MNSQYEKEYMHMILVCLSWEYVWIHKDQQLQAGLIAQLVRVLHCYHK